MPIPEWKWDKLGMDFITGFPRTRSGYDSIWVVVDLLDQSVGDRSRNLKFSTYHQDQSMESSSNERGVHLHTLVDRARKRSREWG